LSAALTCAFERRGHASLRLSSGAACDRSRLQAGSDRDRPAVLDWRGRVHQSEAAVAPEMGSRREAEDSCD